MSKTKRVSLSLPAALVDLFDGYFRERGITNRSQAIELILQDYLAHATLPATRQVGGVIMVIYDHQQATIIEKLTQVQHAHHQVITTVQHLHLDGATCLEAIFVRGAGNKIEKLYDALRAVKGITLNRSLLTPLNAH
ncbi:MAG TPA: CopG family ribbon-helix-helix protein [bacterium]|nr:CopG family ribbon-helix-helix protein [bacterium]